MNNVYVSGESIYLRPLARADAPTVIRYLNDPAVRRTLASYRPMSLEREHAFFDRLERGETDVVFAICRAADDAMIGMTGLHQLDAKNHRALFGITVGEVDEWGKGYGSEATRLMVEIGFDTFNLHRIALEVQEDNLRGIRAYEKAGFVREGLQREALWSEGRWKNLVGMAVLRSEWAARRAGGGAQTPGLGSA